MLSTYEKYKQCCPNSGLTEDQLTEDQMLLHIEICERHAREREGNTVAPPTQEQLSIYDNWKLGRKVGTLGDLPPRQVERIKEAIETYRAVLGKIKRVYLTGSYTAGSWVDESSTAEDRRIRAIQKKPKRHSDIDLVPEPFRGVMTFGRVEFTNVRRGTRVLIYENGKLCG